MDTLTHGLLGLAVGALRRPDADRTAVFVACALAAEIPDLDYLWPAGDSVLHSLKAHRGLSHALLAAPLVALVSTALTKLVFRRAPALSIFLWSLPAVLFAHLLADAWTGWGTRLALPFSEARVTLDWMMVVDPLFTLPLLVGALWGIRKRTLIRRALLTGAAVSSVYLVARVAIRAELTSRVQAAYPSAEAVQVFPSWLGPAHWRYVAVASDRFAAGDVSLFAAPQERAGHPRARESVPSAFARSNATVREALAWARFPIVNERPRAPSGVELTIADLRYHLNGAPTLSFRIELDDRARVVTATLDRGGSARSLFERFRSSR
ncbi:MAG TPA: metal-dependent hydrolase [Polyangiaceae bacterium]